MSTDYYNFDKDFYFLNSETIYGQCPPPCVDYEPDKCHELKKLYKGDGLRFVACCQGLKIKEEDLSIPSATFEIYDFFSSSGYASLGRNIVDGLINKKINLRTRSTLSSFYVKLEFEKMKRLSEHTCFNRLVNGSYIFINSHLHALNVDNEKKKILFTMSEYDSTPNEFHKKILNKADEIWVPTQWNKEIFQRVCDKNIEVIPLGVDTSLFNSKNKKKIFFSSGLKKFVFLSNGTFIWRKGFDLLIKSFLKAFSKKDDVSLLIMSNKVDFDNHIDVNEYFQNKDEDDPHIAICHSSISEELVPSIYNNTDAFALFSRGEGWGLPYMEAIACQKPLIGVNHTGPQSFLNEDDCYLVDSDMESNHPVSEIPFYKNTKFCDFSMRRVDDMVDHMRDVYKNNNIATEKANRAYNRIVDNYSWQKTADLVYNNIHKLN